MIKIVFEQKHMEDRWSKFDTYSIKAILHFIDVKKNKLQKIYFLEPSFSKFMD